MAGRIEDWQERIIRENCNRMSTGEIGRLCGKSREWARQWIDVLGLRTPGMTRLRKAKERKT